MSETDLQIISRNHVQEFGEGDETIVLCHGFGCDQQIWLPVIAHLGSRHRVITFDFVGCGRSDFAAYSIERYQTLKGYVQDLLEVLDALGSPKVTLVGHSVGGLIGFLAAIQRPELFRQIIAIGPSPRYLDDPPEYEGGFTAEDIGQLLAMMERNHFEWAGYLAPIVMKNAHRPELAERLKESFANSDPKISRRFAEATFYCDHREELKHVPVPVKLLYCEQDVIVPTEVIAFIADHLPDCESIQLNAAGHYPHMSHPEQVAGTINQCLNKH
ncbi:alpha/beta fold hydrolase [Pseudidiomarina halophila]|uniref:AB hydrolase-1 domain-containing protein n=1 Tax=Pseudidiomarina halophila TaxID=1449799 RepID=A0A432XW04_9GAMM|nr:alpha/beta hydrolase [Pseudidiomarina halophila]RUO52916.1 hypothetical protein CWI69_07730 [Pseudidiomarina halophila]